VWNRLPFQIFERCALSERLAQVALELADAARGVAFVALLVLDSSAWWCSLVVVFLVVLMCPRGVSWWCYAASGSSFIWWNSPRSQRFATAPMITLAGLPRAAIASDSSRQRGS
jgi:hypothetical protein